MTTKYASKHGPDTVNTIEAIRNLKPFNASNLRGEATPYGLVDGGRLTGISLDVYLTTPDVDYVIISYSTPIAWHSATVGWYQAPDKFSASTSWQQTLVARALRLEEVTN